jgi:glycosyltransferase involved in cell wall biosynthesis
MRPLKIAIVLMEPPLPFGHTAARWYYVLVRELIRRGHRLQVFATCSIPEEAARARELFAASDCDLRCYPVESRGVTTRKLHALIEPYSYLFGPKIRAEFTQAIKKGVDIIHLEQVWSAWIVPQDYHQRSVLNVHNLFAIDAPPACARGLMNKLRDEHRIWAERRVLRRFGQLIALTDRLRDTLLRITPRSEVRVIPFGIDTSLYPFRAPGNRTEAPIVSLIGSMNWEPSLTAAKRLITRLWPEIRARIPTARLEIVGWQARRNLGQFSAAPGIELIEDVPDTQPYFDRASVMLYAPERGSGMKVKVLESIAYGVPVVTTTEGVEGIPAIDGVHAGVCEDDGGLIDRASGLLRDPDRCERQRLAARRLLEEWCGPLPTVNAVEQRYSEILHDRNGGNDSNARVEWRVPRAGANRD